VVIAAFADTHLICVAAILAINGRETLKALGEANEGLVSIYYG